MRGWAARMSFDVVLSASELCSDRTGREDDRKQREYNHKDTSREEQEGRAGGKKSKLMLNRSDLFVTCLFNWPFSIPVAWFVSIINTCASHVRLSWPSSSSPLFITSSRQRISSFPLRLPVLHYWKNSCSSSPGLCVFIQFPLSVISSYVLCSSLCKKIASSSSMLNSPFWGRRWQWK